MKILSTLVFLSCFTLGLGAQTDFQSATSLMDEFATASIDGNFEYTEEAAEPTLKEVEDYFNIRFTSNPIFGDINIVYDIESSSSVVVEVSKNDKVIFTSNEVLGAGTHETIWDENISTGSGVHVIKVSANNKVESIKISI